MNLFCLVLYTFFFSFVPPLFVALCFVFLFVFLLTGNYQWEIDMPCCSIQPSRLCKFHLLFCVLFFYQFLRLAFILAVRFLISLFGNGFVVYSEMLFCFYTCFFWSYEVFFLVRVWCCVSFMLFRCCLSWCLVVLVWN